VRRRKVKKKKEDREEFIKYITEYESVFALYLNLLRELSKKLK